MSDNYFDQFDETTTPSGNFFDQFDEEDTAAPKKAKKPFTGRGTIAARNAAAAIQPLSRRATEFQRYAAIDANTVPSLGTAESRDKFSAEVARKAGEMGIKPELSGLSPEVRASMERVAPSGQLRTLIDNPEVVAAKFRQGWRGMDAGLAALEYNTTGRITIGDNTGDALERSIGGGPTVLEGAAAEKYLRELSSPNEDDATARAFDTVAPMGTRAAANAFAQPESILSLAGGMLGGGFGAAAGMLPTAAKALGAEYQQNLKNGATHQAAFANALAKMGIEVGTEWLGGKYGGEGGAVRSIVTEGGEEGIANVAGYGADALSGLLADNGVPFYEKLPKTFGKALEDTAEAVATGGIAAGALRAITAAPALALSGAQAAQDLLKSKRAKSPSAVPRQRTRPMSVDNWRNLDARPIPAPMDIAANSSPATDSAATSPITVDAQTGSVVFDPKINEASADRSIAAKPQYSSFVASILEDPNVKAVFDSLQDPAARQKMLDDLSLADTLKKEGNERKQLSMAKAAADREWVKTNAITSHPSFAEADAAVRGGATTVDKLRKAVPNLSSITAPLVIKHLEEAGVVSAPDNKKQRTVLQPTPVAAGTTQNNIALPVQPAIQPSVQSDNIATTQNNNVEQKSVLTLPEDVPSIAQERAAVNTPAPAQTETVQKSPMVEPKGPIRLRPPAPVAVAPAVETPVSTAEVGVATTLPAPTQNAAVAPPVQPQAPVEVAPTGLTPQTKARRQKATPVAPVETGAIGTSKVEPKQLRVFDKAVMMLYSGDPDYAPFMRGVHQEYMQARGKNAEGTYVRQVLDGVEPTATPTADDSAFLKTMGMRVPDAVATPAATTPVPTAPASQPRAKAAPKPTPQEAAVAKAQAEVAADKQEKERIAARIPSDAELVGAGLSPAEVTLLKKNPEQHREVLDAVNRGEISTKDGMRPVTEEDITKAKTRPEKDKLTRLKAKYEQATDAPRKLSPASITNVRKEAIARAYERIKSLAQSPNMSQFDAIPNDPESTKAILGLQAEAQKTATTEAELAKKLEDTYVNNYKRNHPEVKEAGNVSDVEKEAPAVVNTTPPPTVVDPVPAGVFVHESNGVYASSGVSEALRGLTSMWRDILTISPKVYITTFADLTANKSLFTGKYATILSLNRYGSANGIKAVLSDGSYIIALNSALTTSQTLEVLGHELGHAHQEVAFNSADDAMKSQLYAAYDDWANSNAQPTTPAKQLIATRAPRSLGRKIGATARPGMTVNNLSNPVYWRSFNEWYADQVARWATTSAVPLTAVEKFFSRLGMAMRAFFNRAHNAKYLPDPRFSAYMAAVTEVAKANPTLGTRVGGDMAIEENANIVTATPPLTDTTGIGPEATIQRIKDVAAGLFRNRGIASKDAQSMIEERTGLESAMMLESEFAVEHVRQALVDALQGANKATRALYDKNLLKYLNGDRTAALPAPLVQRLEELRKIIDDRSLALIALGVVPKDKIATVLKNFGKWTHRDFQAFHMKPGVQNRKGEYPAHIASLAKDGKRDLVGENIEAIKDDMRLPSKAELTKLAKDAKSKNSPTSKASEVQLLLWALRWQLNTEKLSGKNGVVALLKNLSALGESKLQEQAVTYANAMLDPLYRNAPVDLEGSFNPKAGVYADDSALSQDRTPLPKWLKNLWGEYTKWDTVALITLENQSKMISKFVTLARYKARLVAAGQTFEATDPRSKKGYALLKGKIYGPLDGYYIPEKDLWLIQSANTLNAIDAAYGAREKGDDSLITKIIEMHKGLIKYTSPIGGLLKVSQVLISHVTAWVNFSNTAVLLTGALPRMYGALKAVPNGFKIARSSAFGGVGVMTAKQGPLKGLGMIGRALEPGTELNRQLLFLASKNVLHDSVLAADTRRQYKQQLMAEVNAALSPSQWTGKMIAGSYSWLVDRASRVNSFGDEFGKHISWASRVDMLKTIYPNMPEQEVWSLAAKEVVGTMPSYMHALPVARAISATGILGAYMTFNTEVLRNAANSLLLAAKYGRMDNTAAKLYAAQELASVSIRLAGAGLINTALMGPVAVLLQSVLGTGGDDDEEKKLIEAQREAAVKYNSGQGYSDFRNALPDSVHGHVTVLRDLGDYKYTFYSGQRYDPSVFGAMMEAAVYGEGDEYKNILMDTYASLTASVPALMETGSGAMNAFNAGADTKERNDELDRMWAGVKDLGEAFKPGTWKTMQRTEKADEQGVTLTPDEKFFNHMGFTVQIFDAKLQAARKAADYNSVRLDTTKGVKAQMRAEAPELDFQAATLDKLSKWERAQRYVEHLKGLGMDYDTIYAAVKDNPISDSIPEDELVGLYENVFQMPNYIETVEDIRDQAIVKAGENTAEVERIISLYDKYIEQADQSDIQMRAILESQGVTVR